MKLDEYAEVINHKNTYQDIAQKLKVYGRILIGWTDQEGSHFDILFVLNPDIVGSNIQGGIGQGDLFVSVMRMGAFAFIIKNEDTHYNYIGDKLHFSANNITTIKLGELINGIKKELAR